MDGFLTFLATFQDMYGRMSLSVLKKEICVMEFEWHLLPPDR